MKETFALFKNSELIVQNFEKMVYNLFEMNRWPKHDEIEKYFDLPKPYEPSFNRSDFEKLMKKELKAIMKRRKMCEIFSFSIPSLEALQTITEFQPILEVGAGSGFWAALLIKNNCDIIATTIDDKNHPFPKKFTEIEYLRAIDAIKKYPDRTVLCSWPSIDTWPEEILPYIKKRLILIGEEEITATDKFHEIIYNEFKEIKDCKLPRWLMIKDHLTVYERII